MNKILRNAVLLVVVATLVFGVGVAVAQEEIPEPPYGRGSGLMAAYKDEIHQALADTLGIGLSEFDAARAEGQTLADLAEAYGVDLTELFEVMDSARAEAIAQAVKDGTLTQAQADWMLARHASRHGSGLCDGSGRGANAGRGPMGRPR